MERQRMDFTQELESARAVLPQHADMELTQDWDHQNPTQIVREMCGFVTILLGAFLLHKTKDMVDGLPPTLPVRIPKHAAEAAEGFPLRSAGGIPLRSPRATESFRSTL